MIATRSAIRPAALRAGSTRAVARPSLPARSRAQASTVMSK